jgi:MFS family permease
LVDDEPRLQPLDGIASPGGGRPPDVPFAVPAGALADIIDRRRFIIVLEILITIVSAIFAAMVSADLVSPASLLLFTFLISLFGALEAPAWQAMVPQLVPKQDLAPAIAANSVGINISRAIGPAIGGVIIVGFGIAAPFWLNAISNLGVIGVLVWWRSPERHLDNLPAERFASAIRTISLRASQSLSTRNVGASGWVFPVCQRVLGAASASSAKSDRGRT